MRKDSRILFQFQLGTIGTCSVIIHLACMDTNFNSSQVRLERESSRRASLYLCISIPVRYDWNSFLHSHSLSTSWISIPVRYDWNTCTPSRTSRGSLISIPVRYDWNKIFRNLSSSKKDFNSSQVRLERTNLHLICRQSIYFNSSQVRLERYSFSKKQ